MNILIMGGTQFVGKALAKFLIRQNHEVFLFTRNKIPIDFAGYAEHFIGNRRDITDIQQIKKIKFDIVFDISAYTLEDIEVIFKGLDTTRLKKYILCSTGAVYNTSNIPLKENALCGYNMYWKEYGINKLAAENALIQQGKDKKFIVSIIRPSYIYGPGNNLYRESYVFERLSNDKIIPIPDSQHKIQHIFIDDLITIFNALMYTTQTQVEIYNATNSEEITWEYYVQCAAQAVGKEAKIKKVKYQGVLKDREFFPFRDYTYLLDGASLVLAKLPVPKINLEFGMKLSYEWYLRQEYIKRDQKMAKIEEAINLRRRKNV